MKSIISPDIWERKRLLITKLYKDEEWPLKQVIKLVQTDDFRPSESQLRSRLKKWQITKPSRKKYDGSRRLSAAKKSQTLRPQPTTFHTTQSQSHSHLQPRPSIRTQSDRALSEVRSEGQSESTISPTNEYILPSSPVHEQLTPHPAVMSPFYASNMMGPPTPITPSFHGMDDSKHAHAHAHADPTTAFSYPGEISEFTGSPPVAATYALHARFGSFSDPSPLSPPVDHPQADYWGFSNNHVGYDDISCPDPFTPYGKELPFRKPDLPPPLLLPPWTTTMLTGQPPTNDSYPPAYFHYGREPGIDDPLGPLIYHAM